MKIAILLEQVVDHTTKAESHSFINPIEDDTAQNRFYFAYFRYIFQEKILAVHHLPIFIAILRGKNFFSYSFSVCMESQNKKVGAVVLFLFNLLGTKQPNG